MELLDAVCVFLFHPAKKITPHLPLGDQTSWFGYISELTGNSNDNTVDDGGFNRSCTSWKR